MSPDKFVKCVCCATDYEVMEGFEKTRQAYRCSAEIRGAKIYGFYGSTVADMRIYEFKNGAQKDIQDGIVCDTCITSFLNEDLLELKSKNFW